MNTKMSKLALAIGALVMAGGVMAQATNATATATATVLTPLKVVKDTDLVFGSVVGGNGVVTVATDGARSKNGGTAAFVGSSTTTAAAFTVTGEGASTFTIDYAGSTAVLTNTTGIGAETMAIGWITEAVAKDATAAVIVGQAATGTLTAGSAKIFSGATLTVADFQVAGVYTGALKVTVAYN